jgi:hypothetical protein
VPAVPLTLSLAARTSADPTAMVQAIKADTIFRRERTVVMLKPSVQ